MFEAENLEEPVFSETYDRQGIEGSEFGEKWEKKQLFWVFLEGMAAILGVL